mgnify:CR=1 FL=1
MNRLTNVSFVVPVRIDSYERSRNLDLILDFIVQNFDSKIFVLESDSQQKYQIKINNKQIKYIFVKDDKFIFHHTICLNYLYKHVDTPIIVGLDTDIIVPPEQIIEVVDQIECGKAIIGLPYNGLMYNSGPTYTRLFETSRNINALTSNIPYMYPMYGSLSLGGAFIVDTKEYLKSGGDNQYFLGWGPEDFERVKRIEILYPHKIIYKSSGCIFHLWHPRMHNSKYADLNYEQLGKQEYLKICSMEMNELRTYIDRWPWLESLNEKFNKKQYL